MKPCSRAEAIGPASPFNTGPLRGLDDVEYATFEWIDWYNTRRVRSPFNYIPPAGREAELLRFHPGVSAGDVSNMNPAFDRLLTDEGVGGLGASLPG